MNVSNLDHALLFVEIARRGSISAAARELQMTRATAARRLAALEEHLGVQLIRRTTRMLSLTSAGKAYLKHANEALEALERAENAAVSNASSPTGVLRIAGLLVNIETWLAPLLAAFTQIYPEIDVELFFGVDIRDLVAEGFDIGLQVGLEHNAELIMRKLLVADMILVASPTYLERVGTPESLEDLREHVGLLYRTDEGSVLPWRLADGETFVPTRVKLTSNSYDLLIASACLGLGCAVVPRTTIWPKLEAGELVQVMPETVMHKDWASLVYSATSIMPPKVRVFLDFTQEFMGPFLGSKAPRMQEESLDE
jgi:DNA-binding transcriptional LysR family regulator